MEDKTVDYYRQCFSTEAGKRVLANMLLEANFFEYIDNKDQLAVENFMKTVLTKCGTYNKNNIDYYVTSIMNLPRIERKENE